jgi:hypothetical protein
MLDPHPRNQRRLLMVSVFINCSEMLFGFSF